MNIGIITIVYDGYGKFIPRWLDSIFSQDMKPKEVVIVLSRNHELQGTKYSFIRKGKRLGIKVKFVENKIRNSIGRLRNKGIEKLDTEWVLYFSADDILLPNAVEEIDAARAAIKNRDIIIKEVDVIALKYLQEVYGERMERETPIPEKSKMRDWTKNYRNSGYIAFKKSVWEENKYDNNDYPNFPFLFSLVSKDKSFNKTKNPCAVYIKRADSHSGRRTKKQNERAYKTLDEAAKKFGQ